MKFLAGALLILTLSGCLFDSKDSAITFTAESLQNYVDTLYAIEEDGSTGPALGIGFEWRANPFEGLELWQESKNNSVPSLDTLPTNNDLYGSTYYRLTVSLDSTMLQSPQTGASSIDWKTVRQYSGMPCKFSQPRAYQADSTGTYTIPLVVGNIDWISSPIYKVLRILIDTTASKASDPRVRFTGSRDYKATMKITCP